MKRALLLSLTFLSLWAIFSAAFNVLRLDEASDTVTAFIASRTIMAFTDREVLPMSEGDSIWFQVRRYREVRVNEETLRKVLERRRGKPIEGKVRKRVVEVNDVSVHHQNVNTAIPLFLAVVSTLAGRRDWRLGVVLLCGTLVSIGLEGLSLAALVWEHPGNFLDETVAFHLVKLISVWTEGGLNYAPVFVGAVIALTWLSDDSPLLRALGKPPGPAD